MTAGIRSVLWAVAFALVALSVSTTVFANHALGIKWRGHDSPLHIAMLDCTDPVPGPYAPYSWQDVVAAEVDAWNVSTAIHIDRTAGAPGCTVPAGYVGIKVVTEYLPASGPGMTVYITKGNTILQATVVLNTYILYYPQYSPTCHEIGHALGLAHQPTGAGSCMTDGPSSMWPNTHDYEQLTILY